MERTSRPARPGCDWLCNCLCRKFFQNDEQSLNVRAGVTHEYCCDRPELTSSNFVKERFVEIWNEPPPKTIKDKVSEGDYKPHKD
jgi:hypothetical protein